MLQVLGQEAQPVLLVHVRPVRALRRGPVEDGLELLQIRVPDVLLDLLVREVVLAVGRGHDAVRLHYERRLARQPVLQPDLLPRNVQGAVARARHLELREARGRVGVQLQPGDPRGGRVLQHQPGRGGGGRVADAQHPGEALRTTASRCWRRPRLGCRWCRPAGSGTPARSRQPGSGFELGWWPWPRPPRPARRPAR